MFGCPKTVSEQNPNLLPILRLKNCWACSLSEADGADLQRPRRAVCEQEAQVAGRRGLERRPDLQETSYTRLDTRERLLTKGRATESTRPTWRNPQRPQNRPSEQFGKRTDTLLLRTHQLKLD